MKTLSDAQLRALAGEYFAPTGLYQHTQQLPFLGRLTCNTQTLTAGQWAEVVIEYTVGASGLADGAWLKGTFKFYSDWALFQTTDPRESNYVSVEYVAADLHPGQTPATVQSLAVRFDQKGHERPFQKAVIIDVVDGFLNPSDKIVVRLGDRRWGARGTRVQTFVEDEFLMRWYIDPVGTSRFAPVKPDIAIKIRPGPIASVRTITPRVVRPGVSFPVRVHSNDLWGNTTTDIAGLKADVSLTLQGETVPSWNRTLSLSSEGWNVGEALAVLSEGDYILSALIRDEEDAIISTATDYVSVTASIPVPRILFADLHVHSDDTVGTNSTTYNFSYAQKIGGLDIVGYTANDFNITQERWNQTLEIIKSINAEGQFVVFPGTEWCGNSAAGGDHNVVFLDDPDTASFEFPFDRHGNVARSFEWNEHGPAELTAGAWPLDQVYATYAHDAENHLLIPHVGGRRCNLAWHHPNLERLLEIGSAWGLFEWLLRDAIQRGWKLGVSANSDEHRGRCGGGVPGTAVFGTRGGLTGVLAGKLERNEVAAALRARRTFATTGERLVGLVSTEDGQHLQGDTVVVTAANTLPLRLDYQFYGRDGFSSIEAWDASGCFFRRNLQEEVSQNQQKGLGPRPARKLRIRWGGARLFDRYREVVWHGSILLTGATASRIEALGGIRDDPESTVRLVSETHVSFDSKTSGDFDGVDIFFPRELDLPDSVSITGLVGGYVKVGDALKGNPHNAQPEFSLLASREEASTTGGKQIEIRGGADMFVSAEILDDVALPRRAEGQIEVDGRGQDTADPHRAVYLVAREFSGGKTYFEEGLFTGGLSFLLAISSAVSPSENASIEDVQQPMIIPPPAILALAATIAVHPAFTSRVVAGVDGGGGRHHRRDKWEQAHAALRLLWLALAGVGPVGARMAEAFAFRKYGILWTRAEDFWQVVGWALNCSCLAGRYRERWKWWLPWLEFVLDALEADWDIIWQYVELAKGGYARSRRMMRAIFADGSQKALNEFGEVFRNELKAPLSAGQQRLRNGTRNVQRVDVDKDVYATNSRASSRSSRSSIDHDESSTSTGRNLRLSQCPPGSLQVRMRLLHLLSHVSAVATQTSSAPSTFIDLDELYGHFVEWIKPLPLDTFQQLISASTAASRRFGIDAHTTLCEMALQWMLESAAPNVRAERFLTRDKLVRQYLPYAAGAAGVVEQAKVGICLETMLRRAVEVGLVGFADVDELRAAVDKGAERRAGLARPDDAVHSEDEIDDNEAIQEREAWAWLQEGEARMRAVVDMI
ncbi:hypothetical protein DV735_g3517, partial [Chaetothyriales sp. CBS 134920]